MRACPLLCSVRMATACRKAATSTALSVSSRRSRRSARCRRTASRRSGRSRLSYSSVRSRAASRRRRSAVGPCAASSRTMTCCDCTTRKAIHSTRCSRAVILTPTISSRPGTRGHCVPSSSSTSSRARSSSMRACPSASSQASQRRRASTSTSTAVPITAVRRQWTCATTDSVRRQKPCWSSSVKLRLTQKHLSSARSASCRSRRAS